MKNLWKKPQRREDAKKMLTYFLLDIVFSVFALKKVYWLKFQISIPSVL